MDSGISLENAREILIENCHILTGEIIPLNQAVNRILLQPVYAAHDLPAKAQSAVDGFALGAGPDQIGSSYEVIADLKLGSLPQFRLEYNQAAAVSTGGILPAGTVAVVPVEKARLEQQQVIVLEQIKPGTNIKAAGEDFKQNELLLSVGTQLDYADMALLASYGITNVEVVLQPRVAIVCLSANIVPVGMELEDGQIWDSNGPMINALVIRDGGLVGPVVYSGIIGQEKMISQLSRQMDNLEVVIFTGGTFQNGENEAEAVMKALNARVLFREVKMQPGSHSAAGIADHCLLMSLSGNPAACAVNYNMLVTPVIQNLLGQNSNYQRIKARCITGYSKKSGSRRMVRGRAYCTENGWEVEVLPGQKPSMLRSLLGCNAFIDLPAGTPPVEAGEEVSVILLSPGSDYLMAGN